MIITKLHYSLLATTCAFSLLLNSYFYFNQGFNELPQQYQVNNHNHQQVALSSGSDASPQSEIQNSHFETISTSQTASETFNLWAPLKQEIETSDHASEQTDTIKDIEALPSSITPEYSRRVSVAGNITEESGGNQEALIRTLHYSTDPIEVYSVIKTMEKFDSERSEPPKYHTEIYNSLLELAQSGQLKDEPHVYAGLDYLVDMGEEISTKALLSDFLRFGPFDPEVQNYLTDIIRDLDDTIRLANETEQEV